MPLVRKEDGDVRPEYQIPDNIKKLITYDFLKEFRAQLFRINKGYSLDTFAEYGIPVNTSAGGWTAAFFNACSNTNNFKLFDYWNKLEWYDSDIFDGELADMLIEKHLILGNLADVITRQLGIKDEDIVICDECGGWFTRDMVIEIPEDDEDYRFSTFRCLHCQDKIETWDNNHHATHTTDYYKQSYEKMKMYMEYKNQSDNGFVDTFQEFVNKLP